MGKYKKLPVEIEAISFDEFVQYGLNAEGANIVNGQPLHFEYKGHPVTQENATVYLIPTKEGVMHFTPNDVLITGVQGEIYPCKKDIFLATYQKSENIDLTYDEAEKLMLLGYPIALPEWGGFWFKRNDSDKVFVLLFDGYIVDTPEEKYKERNDWKVVTPTKEQEQIISEYFFSKKDLTFGEAIEALKEGKKVTRKGWNGPGMFLYLVPGSTFKVNREPLLSIYDEGTEINYRPHIDLKTADGSIATWSPSGSDALAEDWKILN